MFKHILVATDGSELSARAVHTAAGLAHANGARLTAVNVMPCFRPVLPDWTLGAVPPLTEEEFMRATRAASEDALSRATRIAGEQRHRCETVSVESDLPWKAILRTAQDKGCDAIVMASHGLHGMEALVLGSETRKVLAHAPIPVLVTR